MSISENKDNGKLPAEMSFTGSCIMAAGSPEKHLNKYSNAVTGGSRLTSQVIAAEEKLITDLKKYSK